MTCVFVRSVCVCVCVNPQRPLPLPQTALPWERSSPHPEHVAVGTFQYPTPRKRSPRPWRTQRQNVPPKRLLQFLDCWPEVGQRLTVKGPCHRACSSQSMFGWFLVSQAWLRSCGWVCSASWANFAYGVFALSGSRNFLHLT